MAEVTPFESLLEANNRAKALVKGEFTLDGTDAPEAPNSWWLHLTIIGT